MMRRDARRGLCLLLLLLLALPALPARAEAPAFSDVAAGTYYYDAVSEIAADGVIRGYEDGSFRPEGPVTRAEALTMFLRMAEIEPAETAAGAPWYAGVVARAEALEILPPATPPNIAATREEIAQYLVRTFALPMSKEGGGPFSDTGSAYANTLFDLGISIGYLEAGTGRIVFGGQDAVKRCDVCVMLSRLKKALSSLTPTRGGGLAETPSPAADIQGTPAGTAEDLAAYLSAQVWAGAEEVSFDGADYGDPDMDAVSAVVNSLFHNPDLFALDTSARIYAARGRYTVEFSYQEAYRSDYGQAKQYYLDTLDEIVGQVDPNAGALEKLLFVHDYLTTHFEYDTDYAVRDVCAFFRTGRGVCDAYSLATLAILDRLGIPCTFVGSESLNHSWNAVELDGSWYHMDVTWDDPTPDSPGVSRGVYFLLSTEGLRRAESGRHFEKNDWFYDTPVACDDTRYDNAFWHETVSPFTELDGARYAVSAEGLVSWGGTGTAPVLALSFPDYYTRSFPAWNFRGYVSTAGAFTYNGAVYFNTSFHLLRYEPGAGTAEVVYDALDTGEYLLSCVHQGGGQVLLRLTDGKQDTNLIIALN